MKFPITRFLASFFVACFLGTQLCQSDYFDSSPENAQVFYSSESTLAKDGLITAPQGQAINSQKQGALQQENYSPPQFLKQKSQADSIAQQLSLFIGEHNLKSLDQLFATQMSCLAFIVQQQRRLNIQLYLNLIYRLFQPASDEPPVLISLS